MTKNLKRIFGRGDLHFLTFSCYQRLPRLGTPQARTAFVKQLGQIRDRHGFLLVGYVVMPEHIHMLISEAPTLDPSSVMMVLKSNLALALNTSTGSIATPFWENRFYDFNVYSAYKRREKLDYMHMNPIKRGLVRNPRFWPWSSFLNYEKGFPALIPVDFVS
jgi:putative transposase